MFGHYLASARNVSSPPLRVPPARRAAGPAAREGRHAKGGENGGLPLVVVVKHAFPRHRAGGDVYSLHEAQGHKGETLTANSVRKSRIK
jgi:hypothetical protein